MTEQITAGEEQQEAAKTFTQDDVNRIVAERVKRVKAEVPVDYDDLKAKAAKFDELEEASKSELEKAREAAEKYQSELSALREEQAHAAMVAKVSADTGIPATFLHGATEDDVRAIADALGSYIKNLGVGFPADKGGAARSAQSMTREQVERINNPAERIRARAAMHRDMA